MFTWVLCSHRSWVEPVTTAGLLHLGMMDNNNNNNDLVLGQCERGIGHVVLCMCCWESLLCLWFPGSPCLAEYSDGQYYRAKLIKFTSVEPVKILVRHVDFGSDDTLPPSKYELHTAGVQMYWNSRQNWTSIYTEWTPRLSCTKDLFSNDQIMVSLQFKSGDVAQSHCK